MTQTLSSLCAEAAIDTILHLGAGPCTELTAYLGSAARQIHLVEPLPSFHEGLAAQARHEPRLRVHAVAVAAEAGQARLNLYNLAELSSLRDATGLHDLFPGLRLVDRIAVETVTLAEVLLQLPEAGTDILIIDTPGYETAILDALFQGPQRHRFAHIFTRIGVTPLYKGAGELAQLRGLLAANGYCIAVSAQDDPDRPAVAASLDQAALAQDRLKAELAETAAQLAQIQTTATARISTLETEAADREARLVALKEEVVRLRERVQNTDAALAKAETDRQRLQEVVAQERAAAAALQSRETALRDQMAAEQAEAADQIAQIQTAATARITALETEATDRETRLVALKEEVMSLRESFTQKDTALAQADADRQRLQAVLAQERDTAAALQARETALQDQIAAERAEAADQIDQIKTATTTRIAALEAEAADREARIATLKQDVILLRERVQQKDMAQAQADADRQRLQTVLAQERDAAAALQARETALLDQLTAERAEAAALIAALQTEVTDHDSRNAALASAASGHLAQIAALEARDSERQTRIAALEKDVILLRERVQQKDTALAGSETERQRLLGVVDQERKTIAATLKDREKAYQDQLDNLRREERLRTRLHLAAQGDLQDLQRRYADVLAQKSRQEDLLQKLTPRLQEATRYLHSLAPALLGQEPAITDSGRLSAPSGRDAKSGKKSPRPKTADGKKGDAKTAGAKRKKHD